MCPEFGHGHIHALSLEECKLDVFTCLNEGADVRGWIGANRHCRGGEAL